MSYTTSYYHVVFRTYRSEPTINEEHEQELYAYIIGIAQNLHCVMYRIGGMPEHIHMFVSLPSSLSLAEFVQRVKTESSKWLKANKNFPGFAGWGHEYAGFSYSIRDKDMIINYIKNQKEHHHSSEASILRHSAFFMVHLSHPYMSTGKTIALTRRTFVGKVMSPLLNMLSRLVITFLPRSKRLLISWLQLPSAVILEPKKVKSDTVSTVSPSISHEVMGPDAMIFVF